MKRSASLRMRSREYAWMSAAVLMTSIATGSVSVGVTLSFPIGGWVLVGLALAGFSLALHCACEALRYLRLSHMETRWEWEREVRPRL